MKFRIIFVLLVFAYTYTFANAAGEITLFDSEGEPAAYIDADDDDLPIYLWNGTPVAYLYSEGSAYYIYGFNGKHLGWFDDGVARDKKGYAVGKTKEAYTWITKFESQKGLKKFKPFKNSREFASSIEPISWNSWSKTDLRLFLRRGTKQN